MVALDIHIVPVLSDNYAYVLHDPATGATGIVDPGQAAPIMTFLDSKGWQATHIFNTHHHHDHTDGNEGLYRRYRCPVIGPKSEAGRILTLTEGLEDSQTFIFGDHAVQSIATPGHTRGHIALWLPEAGAVFTGDTLFSLGCGRLFEGTAADMWGSLRRLRDLPPETCVYCGHEYTQSNARFALSVDPDNEALHARITEVEILRAQNLPTLPTTIAKERATNPFLRADDSAFADSLSMHAAAPVHVFAELRARKDRF